MEEVLGWKLSVCSVRAFRFPRSSRLGGGFRRSPCPGFLGSAQGSYELPGSLGNFARELKPTRASSSSRGPASKKARGNGPGFLGIARGVWGPTSRKCLVGPFGGPGGLFGRPAGVWGRLGGLGGSWASWTRLGASWGRLGASWGRLRAVLGPSWAVLEASWAVLGSSWGRLGAQAGRLGGQDNPKNFAKTTHDASKMPPRQPKIRFSPKKWEKMSPSSSDGIFHSILVRFYLKNTSPNFEKSLKIYWKNRHF